MNTNTSTKVPAWRTIAATRREYADSALYTANGPFAGGMRAAEGALCPDGIRRNAYPSSDGTADTFFSIPAYVNVQGRRVYGYVTVETIEGFSSPSFADELTVKFVPYRYRRYAALVEHPTREGDELCIHCGRETVERENRGTLNHREHAADGSFLCDVAAYRANPEGSHTHAEVRDRQRYRVRTEDERA